jgi:ribosomal protein L29
MRNPETSITKKEKRFVSDEDIVNTSKRLKKSLANVKFTESLSNAFNDGDLEKLKRLISENCSSDCKIMACERKESHGTSAVLNLTTIVEGLELVITRWEHSLLSWPDGYFCIKDSTATHLNDGKLAIVSQYSFAGTNIYRPEAITDKEGNIRDFQNGPLVVKDEPEFEIFNPRRQINGTLLMPLNEDGKIESFQFYYSYIDSPQASKSTTASSSITSNEVTRL